MIPLSVPNLNGKEWEYIKDCLDTNWVSSVGSYVDKFEESIADFVGSKYAISTVNGTSALHISLLLSNIQPGDFIVVPNITFIASLNSIKYVGADPILIDIDSDTWQMDLDLLETFLNDQTKIINHECIHTPSGRVIKAIMPVHVLGNMCDMDKLMKIALKYHLLVIEDSTEALGSWYKDKHAGTFGQFGCFSFNGNKIITSGGGGMIVTDDPILAKKAKHITTQAKSDPFEYVHDEIGYNYRLVNVLAALGLAQMELLPSFLIKKKQIFEFYNQELSVISDIQFQKVEESVKPNNWLFTIRSGQQKELIKLLTLHKIQVRPFWVPMNQLKMFKDDIYITNQNISNLVYSKSISLPCSTNATLQDLETVTQLIKQYYKKGL
jgi:perosamine synthetase